MRLISCGNIYNSGNIVQTIPATEITLRELEQTEAIANG
jgi:hypothetical protein